MITYAYPPLNRIASSRIYSWAKYWGQGGHDITVLTTEKSSADGILNYTPKSIEARLSELKYRRKNYVPTKPFANNHGKGNKGFYSRVLRILSVIREKYLPMQMFHKLGMVPPGLARANKLLDHRAFDTVVSTFDPFACHIIASMLKNNHKFFWLADYRDLLTGNNFQEDSNVIRCLERHSEKFFLRRADLISTVSDPLRRKLEILHAKPVVTIENGFDPEEFDGLNDIFFPVDDKIRIVHTGTFYPLKQDPTPLFEAIRELKYENYQNMNRLSIHVFGNKCDLIGKLAQEYNTDEFVAVHGLIERELSHRIQKEADALLFLDWTDVRQQGIITSKIYEYVFAHTPILSIGTDFASISNDFIKKTGTGFLLGRSVPKIKKVLKKLLDHEKLPTAPNVELINNFHKKRLANKLLAEIFSRIDQSAKV